VGQPVSHFDDSMSACLWNRDVPSSGHIHVEDTLLFAITGKNDHID
jgi:hypothetical protein